MRSPVRQAVLALGTLVVVACAAEPTHDDQEISVPDLPTTSAKTNNAVSTAPTSTGSTAPTTTRPSVTSTTDRTMAPADTLPVETPEPPLLVYGIEDERLILIEAESQHELHRGEVVDAIPDGDGGVAIQTSESIEYLADTAFADPLTIVEGDDLRLRGWNPDGELIYSVRSGSGDGTTEDFFVGPAGESLHKRASIRALESSTEGPVWAADGDPVHASCHNHCSIWAGFAAPAEDADALYHGGGGDVGPAAAVAGLSASKNGQVISFVEYDPVMVDSGVSLVLLDGTDFDLLQRHELPVSEGTLLQSTTVSLSEESDRVLVGLRTRDEDNATYSVYDALTPEPAIQLLGVAGIARWWPTH